MTSKHLIRLKSVLKSRYVLSNGIFRSKHVWSNENVVKSPFRDVEIPNTTLNEYVWRILDKHPTKTAAVCGITNRSYTYEKMYKQSQIFGVNLRKKFKINDGDTVGVMLPNMPEFAIIFFGVMFSGGTVTTYNPIYTAYEVQRQLTISETKIIITHPNLVPIVRKALELSKKEIPIISVNINEECPEGTIAYKELIDGDHVDFDILKQVKMNADDVCVLPYSSGTTGLPKGVELTHCNIIANCEQQNTDCRLHTLTTETNQDAVLLILPMFHAYGLSIIMLHKLSVGLKLVTLPRFQPDTFLQALLEYKINLLYLAPPLALFLGSHPEVNERHLGHVHSITCGAAPLPTADIHKLLGKVQHDIHFGQGYGMTEAGPLVSIAPLGCKNYESAGYPLPNIQLRVVNENLKNLGPGQVGELLIKGPNIMKGYKNNLEANKEVFLDDDWYRSGDLARIDEGGLIYISDRLKELIKVNAYQVPPAELESAVKDHPAVHDAAVVGVPDPKTGERPKAIVILKSGVKATGEDIMNFVNEKVAPYKKIKEVEFVDSIPKNASGKILRRVLKEQQIGK
ncbi:uncharacterized protein LOC106130303 [Amyelois transitella]|uniref:uncharacterized protein LOC106130303 n=1 Tax=Amyelois transitella TaxID=680683 RepID=UPI00067C1D73|nr:uncharacterized protein LOC106130303 [Amyelois transitella]